MPSAKETISRLSLRGRQAVAIRVSRPFPNVFKWQFENTTIVSSFHSFILSFRKGVRGVEGAAPYNRFPVRHCEAARPWQSASPVRFQTFSNGNLKTPQFFIFLFSFFRFRPSPIAYCLLPIASILHSAFCILHSARCILRTAQTRFYACKRVSVSTRFTRLHAGF